MNGDAMNKRFETIQKDGRGVECTRVIMDTETGVQY